MMIFPYHIGIVKIRSGKLLKKKKVQLNQILPIKEKIYQYLPQKKLKLMDFTKLIILKLNYLMKKK